MNYEQSLDILNEIQKAKRIVLNCHRGPDPDSIGSNMAMKIVLENMGKDVTVVCPSKSISKQTNFLKGYQDIKVNVDFDEFNFADYDLLLSLDTPNLSLMRGKDGDKQPDIKTIVIDHHFISTLTGFIRMVDDQATSVGEMVYKIFEDWKVEIDKDISECLLTSIIGDTGAFSYPNTTSETLKISAKLIETGAEKNMIVNRIYRNENFEMLKFWSEILANMEVDESGRFVWAMIPYEIYKKYEHLDDAKAKSASLFAPIVENTDFGFIGIEEKPKLMSISFRGRTTFDTSAIAKALGGGGHKASSAVKIEGLPFDSAVVKVLEVTRKYVERN